MEEEKEKKKGIGLGVCMALTFLGTERGTIRERERGVPCKEIKD